MHRAFREFFSDARAGAAPARRASGEPDGAAGDRVQDPERARHNLQLILEGRPLVPYAAHLDATLARLYPLLLDALWKSPDPDEALNQFERLLAAAGPRAGLVELLANDGDLLLGLVKVCAGGDLLTELLIAQPELLASLASPERLLARKSKPALRQALAAVFVPGTTPIERRDRLRRVKQSEELAVVWRYVLGITTIDALLARDDGAGGGDARGRLAPRPRLARRALRRPARRRPGASFPRSSWGSASSAAASS